MPEDTTEAPVDPIHALEQIRYDGGPAVLLFGNDADQRNRLSALVSNAGGRISIVERLDDAPRRIAEHAAPDGVISDIIGADDAMVERILDSMGRGAAEGRFRGIALIDRDQIDLAAAIVPEGEVTFLCEPEPADLVYAISGLLMPNALRLNDISADSSPMRLRELSEEVGRIARALASMSHTRALGDPLTQGNGQEDQPGDFVVDAPTIRAMIRARRIRGQFFHADLFADPAWDMLLDLSAARLEDQAVPVSSLYIAAAVPATTALRYISKMTEFGLLTRISDPHDRRRAFVGLSEATADAMTRCLAAMVRVSRVTA